VRALDDKLEQLRAVINPDVGANDPLAAFHLKLAREGSALDIARQVFVDREQFRPVDVLESLEFAPAVLERWHKGAPIPDELKDEFAAWLTRNTARRLAMSECARRLRSTMDSQWKLAQSEQESDRRMASAFKRWHLEHWKIADVPGPAPAGQDQLFEAQLMAAVRRHAR
jgi:hypothetical protein